MYIVQGVKNAKIQDLSRRYPVVSPTSHSANVSPANVPGRFANILPVNSRMSK